MQTAVAVAAAVEGRVKQQIVWHRSQCSVCYSVRGLLPDKLVPQRRITDIHGSEAALWCPLSWVKLAVDPTG